MGLQAGIHFVLTREPKMGRLSYLATATCPHGTSQHIIFGRAETVLKNARDFRDPHRWAVFDCSCEVVEVVVKPAPEPEVDD
jgi:hypothetical protein